MSTVHSAGFTLIELVIAIAVMAILALIALPNFSIWLQNTQIRTAGEAILNGMQLARAEAVRRNTNVEFQMTTGSGWTASVVGPPAEVIQTRLAQEGSASAAVTITPAGATKITFNGFGGLTGNNDGTASVTEIKIDAPSLAAADSRELCAMVGTGGTVKLCDPQVAAPDPRACTPAVPAGCL